MKKRVISVLLIIVIIALVTLVGMSGMEIEVPSQEEDVEKSIASNDKDTIKIWYTDEALTDFISLAAVSFSDENEEIRVVPTLVSGSEYLENISHASVEGVDYPDLYITTNDTLEKAHLAGLAEKVSVPDGFEFEEEYPDIAVNSCTYEDKIIGYPFYFECASFLYNKTYIDEWARATAEAEIDTEEGEAAQEAMDNADTSTLKAAEDISEKKSEDESADETDSEVQSDNNEVIADEVPVDPEREARVEKRSAELIDEYFPTSMDKLLSFSDMYDAPEDMDIIFKWDVMDIFYNYFFIGDAINVGGEYGDNIEQINIYNESAIKGLKEYQNLNQFFSINTSEISYNGVLEDFAQGKILFTIVTSDAVHTLNDAVQNEEMKYEYRFTTLPDIMEGKVAKSMSVTDVISINGYSVHKDMANKFAAYLSTMDPENLYERAGKVAARKNANYGENDLYLQAFLAEYENSIPLPKMLETSNLWVKLEILFSSVWDGADANKLLKDLAEDMLLQINGEKSSLETIVIEEEVIEEDEIVETETLEDIPE